jgi:hypothetical protein
MSSSELKSSSDCSEPCTSDNPTTSVLGRKVDTLSLVIFSVGILIWIVLWQFTSLRNIKAQNGILNLPFWGMILFNGLMIFTSDTRTFDYHEEETRLDVIKQYAAIVGGMILAMALFSDVLTKLVTPGKVNDYFIIMLMALIVTLIPLLYISFHKEARSMRLVRKVKQTFYNMGIGLLLSVFLFGFNDLTHRQ